MYYIFLANGFEITEAMAPLDVMRRAAENITAFHEHQKRSSFVISEKPGIVPLGFFSLT